MMKISVGVLHGNYKPKWINDEVYNQWGLDFFRVFLAEFSKRSGVPPREIVQPIQKDGDYFSIILKTTTPAYKNFLSRAAAIQAAAEASDTRKPAPLKKPALACRQVFQ